MRLAVVLLTVLVLPTMVLAAGSPAATPAVAPAPTTAPDVRAVLGNFFELPYARQQEIRRQLISQPDLPSLLADLLTNSDPSVRRTALLLVRDGYGDWAVVNAVQNRLTEELSRPNADGCTIAACADILSDWPRWDSIPVLLEAVRTRQTVPGRVARVRLDAEPVGAWREVDSALRLVTGEWPMPEPNATERLPHPNSPGDRMDRENLEAFWAAWWTSAGSMEQTPQVRLELCGVSPDVQPDKGNRRDAAYSMLWIRPTATARQCHCKGLSAAMDDPAWRWTKRVRRESETAVNAIQAGAARTLTALAANPPATLAIPRPEGMPQGWHGRLQLCSPIGQPVVIEVVEQTDDNQPAPAVADALAELVGMIAAQ